MKNIKLWIKKILIKLLKLIVPFIKIRQYMVFGSGYGSFLDNSKYLFIDLVNISNYQCYYIIKNKEEYLFLKDKYPVLYYYNLKTIFIILSAKYFFFTQSAEDIFIYKRSETIGVCLWHATMIKHFGYDTLIERKRIEETIQKGMSINYNNWDYLITAHKNINSIFASATQLKKEQILACGLPRNEILYKVKEDIEILNSIKNKVQSKLNISQEKEIILYAPTFRDENKILAIQTIESFIKRFKNTFENTAKVLLIRLHPGDLSQLNNNIFQENIINANHYKDMQELLIVADVLITDYSSSIFDFAILERPILIYAYDINEYKQYRGLYFDYNKEFNKYGLSYTEDELFINIKNKDNFCNKNYYKKYNLRYASKNIIQALGI